MYSAEIIVNGIKGYVGGSDAVDLAKGVKACAEAIEDATTKTTKNAYDDDDDDPYDDKWYDIIDLYTYIINRYNC